MDKFLEDLSNMCVSSKFNIPEQEQTASPYNPLSNTHLVLTPRQSSLQQTQFENYYLHQTLEYYVQGVWCIKILVTFP